MRVYVAGPINSSGIWSTNMKRALDAAHNLMANGHTPFIPHLYILWQLRFDALDEEDILAQDKEWLLQCHAMVRLPGVSKGADMEERWAAEAGIPVFKQDDENIGDWLTPVTKFLAQYRSGRLSHLEERGRVGVPTDYAEAILRPALERKLEQHIAHIEQHVARLNSGAAIADVHYDGLPAVLQPEQWVGTVQQETELELDLERQLLQKDDRIGHLEDVIRNLNADRRALDNRIRLLEAERDAAAPDLEGCLNDWQHEVSKWLEKQPFYPQEKWQPLLGMGEELGELNHAFLKRSQNIRGTPDEHWAKMKDAIGDFFVYAAGFCIAEKMSLGECLRETWEGVSRRDWNKNATNGRVEEQDDWSGAVDAAYSAAQTGKLVAYVCSNAADLQQVVAYAQQAYGLGGTSASRSWAVYNASQDRNGCLWVMTSNRLLDVGKSWVVYYDPRVPHDQRTIAGH